MAKTYSSWDGTHFVALRRKDSDIEYDDKKIEGTPEPVPKAVAEKFLSVNSGLRLQQVKQLSEAGGTEEGVRRFQQDFFGPLYVVQHSKDSEAYFLHIRALGGHSVMQFGLFDRKTKLFSNALKEVYLKWVTIGESGEFLRRPYCHMEDINGDGTLELVVQEQVHNGNMYNGVVYRFFSTGPASALSQVFALETRVPDIRWEGRSEATIVREIVGRAPGMLKVKVTRTGQEATDVLGTVTYRTGKGGGGFGVNRKECIEQKYCEILVTASDVSDDEFLKQGYDFYY